MADFDYKTTFERAAEEMRRDPAAGRGTAKTLVRVRNGVTCDIEDGPWQLVGDEMPGDGGAGLGPDPGVFVRAGLGACLATGYVQFAAVLGIGVEAIEVRVEADYDARGMLGVDAAIAPGWSAVRYTVAITSDEPDERLRQLVELADERSSVLDIIRRAVPVAGDLKVRRPASR